MQRQKKSGREIFHAVRPSEVLGGVEPLLSNAGSNCDGLLIESYTVKEFGPTPRFCYTDHHLVSIQTHGVVKAVGDRSSRVWYPGSVSICPAKAIQPNFSFTNFRVTVAMLDPAFMRDAVGGAIDADGIELLPWRSTRDEQLERLVLAAETDVSSGMAGGPLFLQSLGTALAAHLLTRHASKRVTLKEYGNAMPKYLLQRATEFIHENLARNVSLSELSSCVEMSPYHFSRLFKRSTGLSPHKYVNRERVRRAQQLISERRLSLADIAKELGFSSQSHFTRTFYAMAGITPSRYSARI